MFPAKDKTGGKFFRKFEKSMELETANKRGIFVYLRTGYDLYIFGACPFGRNGRFLYTDKTKVLFGVLDATVEKEKGGNDSLRNEEGTGLSG